MKSVVALFLAGLFLCFGVCANAHAQEASPAPAVSAPAPSIAPGTDPATATRAWLDTVPADKRAKSDGYFEGGYWLILWNFLLNAAIALFLLGSGISARLRDRVERLTRFKAMQVALYTIAFILLNAVLGFPLAVYEGFYREHQYGLATQTFGGWFGDQIKGLGFALIGVSILLIVVYAIFRKAPRTWWIWAAAVMTVFGLLISFIFPVFIAPAFNKYTPLEDPAIREPILALARANQIPVDKVFVVDASRQTTKVSANVAGFLGTTRIALNDNLLKQCTLPEIRHVMGHEMGHYVLNHGAKLATYSAIFFLVGFGLTNGAFEMLFRKRGAAWGVRGIADPAGLPMVALIFATYSFLATPVSNTFSRVTEIEADIFGLNTAREPDASAKVALKLGTYRKMDPTALEEFIFFDHPSGRARIRMAMDWKAAHLPAGGTE
ncbi:MAG: endopeptidase [Verrucomicrobiota bacterium]|jgi:STE24 endopeptidase